MSINPNAPISLEEEFDALVSEGILEGTNRSSGIFGLVMNKINR